MTRSSVAHTVAHAPNSNLWQVYIFYILHFLEERLEFSMLHAWTFELHDLGIHTIQIKRGFILTSL